jgi:putative DNA primase/helicase
MTRDRRMTKVTTATPRGDCPVWRNFLVNVTGGDEELQDYLQRVVGYRLTGDIEHPCTLLPLRHRSQRQVACS